MVEPTARIRPVNSSDDKTVRFFIGKSNMESLAVANRRTTIHPVTVAIWIGLSCIFVQIMKWWPNTDYGWMGYLSPLPAFASMAAPILALIDWLNRPYFEKHTQEVLRRVDVLNIPTHYSQSPASGFWILEYGEAFVGFIAIDASKPTTAKSSNAKGTSSTATIRHFYVQELYRAAKLQDDLLAHAVRHTFTSDGIVQSIRAADSPLIPYVGESLRSAGFKLQEYTEKVGVLRWNLGLRALERTDWKQDL